MEAPGLYMYIEINKDVCFTDSSPEAGPSNVNEDQKQRKREEKAVLQDLLSDLPEDEEDYLDLTCMLLENLQWSYKNFNRFCYKKK
jgi:hypothetical protein